MKIGNYEISYYFVFNFIALLLIASIMSVRAKKENLNSIDVFLAVTLGAAFAAIGANLPSLVEFFINHFPAIIKNPSYIKNWEATGGYFFGAFAGGVLFVLVYVRKFFKGKALNFLDILAAALPLGQAVGRLGCFMSGCCYGRPTSLPWGIKFPFLGFNRHPFYNAAVHPTQIYEFILDIINFIFLLFYSRQKKFAGQVFSQYLINYGIIRFFLEYFRGDVFYLHDSNFRFFSLTLFQIVSLIFVLSGIIMKKILKKRLDKTARSS